MRDESAAPGELGGRFRAGDNFDGTRRIIPLTTRRTPPPGERCPTCGSPVRCSCAAWIRLGRHILAAAAALREVAEESRP